MPSRQSRAVARRRIYRRRRQVVGTGLMLFVALLLTGGFRLASALTGDTAPTATSRSRAPAPTTGPHAGAVSTKSKAGAKTPSKALSKTPSATATAGPASVRATGEYTRAPGSTAPRGTGTLRTYRVEVETGTAQSATAFAAAVDTTLADPSSWAGAGRWSLQRVDGDAVVDFVIRLATPATVDKVCATVGLDTRGYVSCRAGQSVMVNLDRWLDAVPDYRGDVALYRQYVINHEVGHQLGYSHQACPGPGRLAPVMQQQTFGLDGCQPNGSPYDNGVLVSGPAAR